MNRTTRVRPLVWLGGVLIAAAAAATGDLEGLFSGGLDHPAIQYAERPVDDAVARLNRKLQDGGVRLQFEGPQGYLRSVLNALDIPVESQMAVFSKTSLQARIIGPENPRTIYFNDSVSAAWVRGEPFVELASADPRQGVIFYTLDQSNVAQPRFVRRDFCISCHESFSSLGVPGMLVRSVVPAPNGSPMRQMGEYLTDHRSPWGQRWGGWYVSGRLGTLEHMGKPANLDGGGHLTPYSDVVALMVFGHQMHLTNLLIRMGWEVRLARHEGQSETLARILRDTAREVADYLLFVDEPPLPGTVRGTSGFAEKFAARGPDDSHGRSLRQFDLERRMMRFPCSYMIYSEAFDGLPVDARDAIWRRLWQILSGQEKDRRYARLTRADRTAVIEILRETKKGLPDYFIRL